jgi:hypothetical protein
MVLKWFRWRREAARVADAAAVLWVKGQARSPASAATASVPGHRELRIAEAAYAMEPFPSLRAKNAAW